MIISRADRPGVGSLLREAARRFDASAPLRVAAWPAARRGFQGGTEWMALALGELRGAPVAAPRGGAARLGLVKYGIAITAAVIVAAIVGRFSLAWAVPLAIVTFYGVEALGVFVFPALASGVASPWRQSLALVGRAGGTAAVASKTLVIAGVMLFGGLAGRGFLRSWCIGCLAIVLWYERLRT